MQRKLLLTSYGLPNKPIQDTFLSLLPKPVEEIAVGHVITAALGEKGDPVWVDNSTNHLKSLGISHIVNIDLKGKTKSDLEQFFQDKDVIFVNGGNTYYLLKYVKESGFDTLLPSLLDQGKIYLGLSAGSILPNPTIQTASWEPGDENEVGLTDLTALSIVPFLITPHFTEEYKQAVEAECAKIQIPVIALTDEQAILCTEKGYEIVGLGEKLIYPNRDTDFANTII